MIAAWRAATLGHRVILLEANARLGVKLRISGGGKCNITHDGSINELLAAFRKEQARFLRPSFHGFGNQDVLDLLVKVGVETYVRENGRIFPADHPGSAAAVVQALEDLVRGAGVQVRLGTRVTGIAGAAPCLHHLQIEGGEALEVDQFIFSTGGASYPETGTRGEILGWLRDAGVSVVPWFPALAPIPLRHPFPEWEGVPFRGGSLLLLASEGGKILAQHPGDILFTKTAITGPAALELCRDTEVARRSGSAWLAYAFAKDSIERLEVDLMEEQRTNPHLSVRHWLQRWIPERITVAVLVRLEIPLDQRLRDLPKTARRGLAKTVRAFPLGEPGPVNLARGEVASGGVQLGAVDSRTMRLKGWDNLRVCGELLDVDGPIGGYNLQAAFSTGFAAGSLVTGSSHGCRE